MRERPNHTLVGLAFVAVCVVIALAIYVGSHASTQSNAVVLDNLTVTNMEAVEEYPVAAPTDQVDQSDDEQVAVPGPPEGVDPSEVGQCRNDGCSLGREVARETVRASADARLIKLSLLGGTSDARGVHWESTPHELYVFCSIKLPAVAIKVDDGWQVDVLDQIEGPPTVLESSQSVYSKTCHGGDAGYPANAASLGYKPLPEDQPDATITQPDDLFELANRW